MSAGKYIRTLRIKNRNSLGTEKYHQEHPGVAKKCHNTPEAKANQSIAALKCQNRPDVKAKKSVALTGENNGMFGRTGEKSPTFKGGILWDRCHWTCSERLKEEVRKRDNQTCQLCDRVWIVGEKLFDTHHIYGSEDKVQPCDMSKLITLCSKCHQEIRNDFEQYIFQFEKIVNKNVLV